MSSLSKIMFSLSKRCRTLAKTVLLSRPIFTLCAHFKVSSKYYYWTHWRHCLEIEYRPNDNTVTDFPLFLDMRWHMVLLAREGLVSLAKNVKKIFRCFSKVVRPNFFSTQYRHTALGAYCKIMASRCDGVTAYLGQLFCHFRR